MIFKTFCLYHLGDNLIHLNYLRKLAAKVPSHKFEHFMLEAHLSQCMEVVSDIPNIRLEKIDGNEEIVDAIDAWKGADGFWHNHPLKFDFANFHIAFFEHLSRKLGIEGSPIASAQDLLFDYPALLRKRLDRQFDYIVINSAPNSGQLRGFSRELFEELIRKLAIQGKRVISTEPSQFAPCTREYGLTVTGIGNLSLNAKFILGVATGPSWPTFNVFNNNSVRLRVLLCDREKVLIAKNSVMTERVENIEPILFLYSNTYKGE